MDTEDLIANYENRVNEIEENSNVQQEDVKNGKNRLFILEPAVFLLFFAWNVSSVVFTNQIVYQTCTVTLRLNETDCAMLGTNNESEKIQEIEKRVQVYTANLIMARSLIESIIPALCSLFIGPWSDKFGRKPVIMATFGGYLFTYFIISLICFISTKMLVNPWLYILAFIPAALSGGNCALITGIFCYITDVTNDKNRAIKMGVLEAVIYLGLLAGSLSSSYILLLTNATTVFAIATITIFIGVVYNYFFIHETVSINELDIIKSKVRELFRFELVRDMLQTCFKRRLYYDRAIIVSVMIILGASIFAMEGTSIVFYLFVRVKFEWAIKDFNLFESISIVVYIVGNILGMYLIKKLFGLSEIGLAMLSFVSAIAGSVVVAFAVQPWHLYLAIGMNVFKAISGPMCRAIISNVAPSSDIGKIYSLTTSIESLTPLAAAPLYTMVYAATLDKFPGAFSLITAGIFTGCLLLLIVVYYFQRAYRNFGINYTSINS